jgi:O-antigen ligase
MALPLLRRDDGCIMTHQPWFPRIGPVRPWTLIFVLAVPLAIVSTRSPKLGLAISGAIALISIAVLRVRRSDRSSVVTWIPLMWLALLLVSDHRFAPAGRTPLEASRGQLSADNLVQVAVYAVVLAFLIHARSILAREHAPRMRYVPLLLLPAFALISTLWSPIPVFTFGRALQLAVIAAAALITARVWQLDPEQGAKVWRDSLKFLVQAVSVLAVFGFLVRVWPDDRFTWNGTSAGGAAVFAGAALLILLIGGPSFNPRPSGSYLPRVLLLAAAIALAQTRSVIAAFAIALLAALWMWGRERPILRYAGIFYYISGLALLVSLAWVWVIAYLERGGGVQGLATLNSRIPLWEVAINDVSTSGRWLAGFGYGAPRVVLFPQVQWAGTAHSSWIEALVGTGVIGTALLAATVVFVLWRLTRSGPGPATRVAFTLAIFLLVLSVASELLVIPGVGFGLFALVSVPALVTVSSPTRTITPDAWKAVQGRPGPIGAPAFQERW